MRYEYSEKEIYNQLLYFRGLFDVDAQDMRGEAIKVEAEKLKVLRELMRERFTTCRGVVEGYLKRCGRVWVQMDTLFGYALGR